MTVVGDGVGVGSVDERPALRPDVVLMDVRMPVLDGIAATARLHALDDPLDVLVLTTFGEDEVLWGAIEAGAAGFVLKNSLAEDLIAAVRAVAGGGASFDPGLAPRRSIAQGGRRPAARDATRLDEFTDREHDVLRPMARGATNAEIAAALFVAEATVKDPRRQHLRQARRARPRRRDRVRVRPRRDRARQRVAAHIVPRGERKSDLRADVERPGQSYRRPVGCTKSMPPQIPPLE